VVCRISTVNQDERSLADQEALYRNWLAANYDNAFEVTVLASQGSGECLERADYLQSIALVEDGTIDLVLTEDIGRICRRVHAHIFAELCEDKETRLIAINDSVDTGRDDWRLNSFFAVMRHESYNRDTAARIRRSQRNRFQQGGVIQFIIYGYVKPPGAKHETDLLKDPGAASIYQEWFRRLEQGATFAEIADWLNRQGIPLGPLSRTKHWTASMVSRITRNPILKGVRVRNRKVNRRINSTGRRRAVAAAAEDLLERYCPHLAFFNAEYFDRIVRLVVARNARCSRRRNGADDPRRGVPRKRTIWPGQHMRCGICNRFLYWAGSNEHKILKCSGSREYLCWNAVEVNGPLVARKLSQAILEEIMRLPGFDDAFSQKIHAAWQEAHSQCDQQRMELRSRMESVDRQIGKITVAIAELGLSVALREKLKELETERVRFGDKMDEIKEQTPVQPILPSLDAVKSVATEIFANFATDQPEIARIMQRLIPNLTVYPYQLCDGGNVVLRAHFVLHLSALCGPPAGPDLEILRRPMTVDLFDPPQRERFRTQVVAMRAAKLKEREIASRLGVTQPAVQYAAALQRRMDALGLTDPYVRLTEPSTTGHVRRHNHPRYRFDPLDPDSVG